MAYEIDEAWSQTDPLADVAAGINAVSLYLSYDPSKNATPQRVAAYHGVGIDVMLNWEAQAGDPLKGAGLGNTEALEANRQADALGAPRGSYNGCPPIGIYFSCDTDASVDQVRPYYAAASQVTRASQRRVGAYGGAAVVIPLLHEGVIDLGWVSNASSWDHGVPDTGANLHQLLGHPIHVAGSPDTAFDVDVELTADFGQWYAKGQTDLLSDERIWLKAAFDEIDFIFKVISGDPQANSKPNFLTDIHNAVGQTGGQFAALNAAITKLALPGVQTDPTALATALAPLLTAAERQAVVDVLHSVPQAS